MNGTGIGVSVREIARTLGEMMGKPHLIAEANPPEIDPLVLSLPMLHDCIS